MAVWPEPGGTGLCRRVHWPAFCCLVFLAMFLTSPYWFCPKWPEGDGPLELIGDCKGEEEERIASNNGTQW